MRYGSSFSGIDTFAAAVEAETEGEFTYGHACEWDGTARKGLLAAWRRYGLTEATCYHDARGPEAADATPVDLFVMSPTCEPHSKRNHHPDPAQQVSSMADFWRSLEFVRRTRPPVVIVENVDRGSAVGPITGMLLRLEGYAVESAELDPRRHALAPMARERRFWLLTRLD